MVGASTRVSIFLLVLAVGVACYYFFRFSSLNSRIAALEDQKNHFASQVESMREVEDRAKQLAGKYFLLQKYLESRIRYSSVMMELFARVPQEVTLSVLDFEGLGRRATISGGSTDAIFVSSFVSRLAKEGNASSDSGVDLAGRNAFINVRLDSLSVSEEEVGQKGVQYSVSFDVNGEAFLK